LHWREREREREKKSERKKKRNQRDEKKDKRKRPFYEIKRDDSFKQVKASMRLSFPKPLRRWKKQPNHTVIVPAGQHDHREKGKWKMKKGKRKKEKRVH